MYAAFAAGPKIVGYSIVSKQLVGYTRASSMSHFGVVVTLKHFSCLFVCVDPPLNNN